MSTPPVIDEVRVNALMAALQGQRDAALNQAVMLSADLASLRDELDKAKARIAELDPPPPAKPPADAAPTSEPPNQS